MWSDINPVFNFEACVRLTVCITRLQVHCCWRPPPGGFPESSLLGHLTLFMSGTSRVGVRVSIAECFGAATQKYQGPLTLLHKPLFPNCVPNLMSKPWNQMYGTLNIIHLDDRMFGASFERKQPCHCILSCLHYCS